MRNNYSTLAKWLTLVTVLSGLAGCVTPTGTLRTANTPPPIADSVDASASVTNTDSATKTVSSAADAPALSTEELANTNYPLDLSATGSVQLENGRYSEPLAPGSASELVVTINEVAYGDLNGDGVDDAAVVLVADSGGSGTFYYLEAVLDQSGEPEAVASILLGDRIKLQSIAVADEEILVKMLTQGPQDAQCCPTQDVTNTYKLEDNKLVLSSTTESK